MPPPPPPIAPPPWPPPAATSIQVSPAGGSLSARSWPIAGLIIGALITAAFGGAAGAAGATAAAASTAAHLEASGDFARAIAIDETIETRTGLAFVLDPSAASDAARTEELTLLAWAKALGREGRVDEAVALYRSVDTGPLRARATDALAVLLYASSASDAARGAYPSAILRLEQIVTLAPHTADGKLAQRQLPFYQAGEARQLLAAGRAADAVAALDTIVAESSAQATQTADSLYPPALLGAGQEAVSQQSYKEALVDLRRLVAQFPGTAQASQALAMLSAPVSVSGTLVSRSGTPASGPVRLSTHYTAEPGGTYRTSGPFYYSTSDAAGDFTFRAVPIGGPYILEVFTGGNWTTLINPGNGQPAHPVKVTALVPVDLTFVVLPS
jgi:tetratricopeptide (TPR) repeat protein